MKLTPSIQAANYGHDLPPMLLVVIDTEEEFDWNAPFDRASRSVTCIDEQYRAQRIFETHDIVPTYVVDYPVAATPSSYELFRDWQQGSRCVVGAHLHPWVNPPDEEDVCTRLSYPGNLPANLERRKLAVLTEAIEANIGKRPTVYKAGRYGLGPHTAETLTQLGYEIDLSVVPATDFGADGGPNYRGYPGHPYWFGNGHTLFEVPLTRGYPGTFGGWGEAVHRAISCPLGLSLHLPGIFSRLGLVERGQLSPEGISVEENKRLVKYLLGRGQRIFTYAYHSSSLLPGGSPYVRTAEDRDRFVDAIDSFLHFFRNEIGGRGATPHELKALAKS